MIVSARKIQIRVPTRAATWLWTSTPTAIPASAQIGAARRSFAAAPSTSGSASWLSAPTAASQIEPTTANVRNARSAKPIETRIAAIALATTTISRRGVVKSVGVIVPCRNSVVTTVIARISASNSAKPAPSTTPR